MQTHNVQQGTPEWLALRAAHLCASDAPAMMGTSAYKTRNQLLQELATGFTPEIDAATQARFDLGHEAEAAARSIAESMIGEELFPAVGTTTIDSLPLLASFDGITMLEDVIYEHKLFNQALSHYIIQHDDLPDSHWPQVEHQLLVSGAEHAVFITSDGTESLLARLIYSSRPKRRAALIAGWKQLQADREAFVPQEAKTAAIAEPVDQLPAVLVKVDGALTIKDNLPELKDKLRAFVAKIDMKPTDDQGFANLEAAGKEMRRMEKALAEARVSMRNQVVAVGTADSLMEEMQELARKTAIAAEKAHATEKENRKAAIVQAGKASVTSFIESLEHAKYLPAIIANFSAATKNLRTFDSYQNAVDSEVARVKIEVQALHDSVAKNIATVDAESGFAFLFSDRAQLVLRDPELVEMTVKQRIAEHQESEAKRLDAERERIRAEEQAKVQQAVAQPATAPAAVATASVDQIEPAKPVSIDDGRTIKLGQICDRLGFTVTAQFLESLGFKHVSRDRAAYLYRESDFSLMCHALIVHIRSAQLAEAA
ncbi:YqaJ viral recombinase family protein [Uliginosibacterium sp. sgz301328]|uniref:YqaJ viral recombinase family protein n=1 Tax=Uliginosibacterium sp. sgz301328 TaxID=3243764 RepID=UPI00359E13F8